MKKTLKLFIIISFIIITLLTSITCVYAQNLIDPDYYDPSQSTETVPTEITNIAGTIFGIIQVVGIVISVIVIVIMGVKYMVASVEEKADYKKSMIPYIVGVVLLVSVTTLVRIIFNLTTQAETI